MLTALRIAATVATGVCIACGGGPNTPNGPFVGYPGDPGGPPPTKLVDVKVTVTVPQDGIGLRSDYLSPNTASLSIQLASVNGKGVTGVNPTVMNTLPKARDCKAQAQGTVCQAIAKGSPGRDVFSVIAYSGVNATGSVLSLGPLRATISSGSRLGISNRMPLSLGGVIASLKLSLDPNKAKRGTKTTADVLLAGYDATGAEIVGPSNYVDPIRLTIQGNTDRAFALHEGSRSGQSLLIRKPLSGITLTYDGNEQASPVTLNATVSGPSGISQSASFNLTGKQGPPPAGTIYVLNYGSKSGLGATITEYSGTAKGNAAPERTLALDSKLYAVSLALDASGKIYVGYFDSALGASIGKPDTGNEIAVYASTASGNDQPTAVIQADSSTSTALYPIFIAFDPNGRLVTYGATTVDNNHGNAVLLYAAGASGKWSLQDAFAFKSPTLYYPGPSGLSVDAKNNFYLNGTFRAGFGSAYGVYIATPSVIGNPYAQPSRVIPWNSTTELSPGLTTDVALDKSAEIFVGNVSQTGSGSGATCQARANVFSAGTTGSGGSGAPPLRVLTLDGLVTHGTDCSDTQSPLYFYFPEVTMYAGSELFTADDYSNAIAAFSAAGNHVVKPILLISGSATQLNAPVAIAITKKVSGGAAAVPVTGAAAPESIHFDAPNAQ